MMSTLCNSWPSSSRGGPIYTCGPAVADSDVSFWRFFFGGAKCVAKGSVLDEWALTG